MVEKCPAKYKNLNYIQSFSEQGYATIQLMQQACMNDEWLRQNVLKLNYLSPPAVRKWIKEWDKWIDDSLSYGYRFDGKGNIVFDNVTTKRVSIDFYDDEDLIDMEKTDAVIMSYDRNSNKLVDAGGEEDADLSTITTNDEDSDVDYDSDGNKLIFLNDEDEIDDVQEVVTTEENIVHLCQLPYENEAEKKTYTSTTKIKGQTAIHNLTTRTIKKNQGCNSAWYVGFNKAKDYHIRPDWIKDWRDPEIPSVCRGQTFKATVTGKLESIDLKLDYNGTHNSNCGSPLYVQIWNTYQASRPKTVWNASKKKMEYVYKKSKNNRGDYKQVNGKWKQVKKGTGTHTRVYEKVAVPKATYTTTTTKNGKKVKTKHSTIYKPLAQATYNPSKMKSFDLVNIKFDKQVKLTKGKSYFIALFSPLSAWQHCPRWGGWGRNCANDGKYKYGNAFLSENNGRSWIRFGRNDLKVPYKKGQLTPQDFAFQCHIRTRDMIKAETKTVVTLVEDQIDDAGPDNPRYLYLKPIFTNPITHIKINADDYGGMTALYEEKGVAVRYDFSTDLKTWTRDVVKDKWYELNKKNGKYPHILFVRARLYRDITTMEGNHQKYYKDTPQINTLSVDMKTQLPKEMYVRSFKYAPPLGDTILGASLWGRFYSNFVAEPTVDCTAEIITNKKPTPHFRIIEVENVREYYEKNGTDMNVLQQLEDVIESSQNNTNGVNDSICEYLYNHHEVVEELKSKNIYIKPYEMGDYVYRLSFAPEGAVDTKMLITDYEDALYDENHEEEGLVKLGGLKISNNVAYPILECTLTPDNSSTSVTGYGEWYDFTFDYDNNILTFYKDVLEEMPCGDIGVTFNEVFVEGLSDIEVGSRVDEETGLKEQGLVLDYFKETFVIDEEMVETRKVKLRVSPVDPIREVVLNRDTDDEQELFEGFDYDVSIDNCELEFYVNNTDGVSSVLSVGDVLEVVYTPNLDSTSVSVAYWVKRTDTSKNVSIGNSYWEYKV